METKEIRPKFNISVSESEFYTIRYAVKCLRARCENRFELDKILNHFDEIIDKRSQELSKTESR